MKRRIFVGIVVLAAAVALATIPSMAEDERPGVEDALYALVEATTRLVESVEIQAQAKVSERELAQVQIGVQLLDIRVRQQESLQRRLDSINDREQRLTSYIATNDIKLESIKKMLAETVDETSKLELEAKRDERRVYIENQKKELDYLSQRRASIESRLVDGDRSVMDIEEIVQDWVGELQNP